MNSLQLFELRRFVLHSTMGTSLSNKKEQKAIIVYQLTLKYMVWGNETYRWIVNAL